ncbi:hypothetical protein DFH27DRAFT_544625 [Peziza echinospora]|nr:hypothetical protein DFH27DRAFT_544625 [Peziza echinospora]
MQEESIVAAFLGVGVTVSFSVSEMISCNPKHVKEIERGSVGVAGECLGGVAVYMYMGGWWWCYVVSFPGSKCWG